MNNLQPQGDEKKRLIVEIRPEDYETLRVEAERRSAVLGHRVSVSDGVRRLIHELRGLVL